MHILLVEDDPSVAAGVIDGLENAGFSVTHLAEGIPAISSVAQSDPDLVLLDLGLPDVDGQDVCREIRKISKVPIIILSARGDELDRVLALELGADDFVGKPFGIRELVARIRAVHRRISTSESAPASQQIGPLVIDRRAYRVFVQNKEILLTSKEFELLAYLATDPGAVYRRNDIMNEVWDVNWYGTTKTVDAHVASIRKKLDHQDWIESVRGVGFRLNVDEK